MTQLAVVMLVLAACVGFAVLQHDVLRLDACLDSGGAWDREANGCIHDATTGAMPLAYPRWIFVGFGTASAGIFLGACLSVASIFRRRWGSARRLAVVVVLSAAVVFVATMGLATKVSLAEPPLPWTKAMRLGSTISEFMNCTLGIYLAGVIGSATWLVTVWGVRRERRRDPA